VSQLKNKNIIFAITLVLLFIILSFLINSHITTNFEINFYKEITEHMSNILTLIMKIISYMGNTLIVILICIILILIPKIRWKYGLVTAIGVIISTMFNNLLKVIFLRERPNVLQLINENSYSFPSGHSMINMTMYSLLAILLFKNIKNKKFKYLIPSLVMLIPIIIGVSRVYLGVHYITDVIGGWIFGLLITVIVYQIYKIIKKNKEAL